MNSEVISHKQGIVLIIILIIGDALVFTQGVQAGSDFWLAIMLAFIFALVINAVYAQILALYPGKDLFTIAELVFGKIFGKFIIVSYVWFALFLGALIMREFSEYINVVSLPETPILLPLVFMILLCIWAAVEGIEVLGRCGQMLLFITLVITGAVFLMLISQTETDNLRPFLYHGWQPVFLGAFTTFAFPFAETVICLTVFSGLKTKNYHKVFFVGLAIGGAYIFITSLTEIMLLGVDINKSNYFPARVSVSRINIGNFLHGIEILVDIIFIFCIFVMISLCLIGSAAGTAKLFNIKNYRAVVVSLAVLMGNLSYLAHKNVSELVAWTDKVWPYYALPFEVILPLIILAAALLKKGASKDRQ